MNKSVQSFELYTDAIDGNFTNGGTRRFDLVVGADGIGSRMRKLMLSLDTNGEYFLREVVKDEDLPNHKEMVE